MAPKMRLGPGDPAGPTADREDVPSAAEPWEQYRQAAALLPVDPAAAQRALGEAYAAFGDDLRGRLLAASGSLAAILFRWDDASEGPHWFSTLATLEPERRALADPLVDAQVLASGATAVLFDLGNPLLTQWAGEAERLLPLAPPAAHNGLVGFLVSYYVWHGELASCRVLLHHADKIAAGEDPLFAVRRHIWSAVLGFLSADHDRALASIEAGQQLARASGLLFLLPQLHGQETYTALSLGDLPRAERAVAAMTDALLPGRRLDRAFLQHLRSGVLLAQREYAEARRAAERAITIAADCATPTQVALVQCALAQVLVRQGAFADAWPLLDEVDRFARDCAAPLVGFVAAIARADGLLGSGQRDRAADVLAAALPVARANDWYNAHPFWQPGPVSQLCALALAREIEVEYVHRLVRRRGLPPPVEADDSWPWPVRIRTLGAFTITLDGDRPVRSGQQIRPLQLLKALIAFNPDGTSTRLLADELWGDADGDAALHALEVNLQRLRRLLGRADAVVLDSGVLTLNRQVCWVDAWTLDVIEQLVKQRESVRPERLVRRLLRAWRGEFLPGQETRWALAARQRIAARGARVAEGLGEWLHQAGAAREAIDLYRRIVEVDPLAETVCRQLMKELASAGRHAEALLAYQRTTQAIATRLGCAPSPATRELAEQLRREAGPPLAR
jgi:DNA-binding SARP family transcriptional activator